MYGDDKVLFWIEAMAFGHGNGKGSISAACWGLWVTISGQCRIAHDTVCGS